MVVGAAARSIDMKRLTKTALLWLTACVAVFAAGCTTDNDPEIKGSSGRRPVQKLQRLDLAGAKSLTLLGTKDETKSSESLPLLFKLDESGNLSAVQLYVEETREGGSTVIRTDISVHPRMIFKMAGNFTYLFDCKFFDSNGRQVDIDARIEEGSLYCNILVNNATGKIYYVPQAAHRYFPQMHSVEGIYGAVDNNGTLFVTDERGHLVRVLFSEDRASVESYGPPSFEWSGDMHVLPNGTLAFYPYHNSVDLLYPNGGFESLSGYGDTNGDGDADRDVMSFTIHDGRIYAIIRPLENFQYEWQSHDTYDWQPYYLHPEVSISVAEVVVGTSFGSVSVLPPFATVTGVNNLTYNEYHSQYMHDASDWTCIARSDDMGLGLIFGQRYMFINNILAYERSTGRFIDLVAEGLMDKVMFDENGTTVYQGKTWKIYSDVARWFDIETLEYGEIAMPSAGQYLVLDWTEDIPNGKVYRTVISPADGKRYLHTISIDSGEYTSSEVEDDRVVIKLVPLN